MKGGKKTWYQSIVPTFFASMLDMLFSYPLLRASKIKEAKGVYNFRFKNLYKGGFNYYSKGYLPSIVAEAVLSDKIDEKMNNKFLSAALSGIILGPIFAAGESSIFRRKLSYEKKVSNNFNVFSAVHKTYSQTRGVGMTCVRESIFASIVLGDLNSEVENALVKTNNPLFANSSDATYLTKAISFGVTFTVLYSTQIPAAIGSYQQGAKTELSAKEALSNLLLEGKKQGKGTLASICRGGGYRIASIAMTALVFSKTKARVENVLRGYNGK